MHSNLHKLACGLLFLATATIITAGSARAEGVLAGETVSPTSIQWVANTPHEGVSLSVSGPDDFFFTKEFRREQALSFSISEGSGGPLEPGPYWYVLVFAPVLDDATKAALIEARRTNDDTSIRALRKEGRIPNRPRTFFGSFLVENGAFVSKTLVEPGSSGRKMTSGSDPEATAEIVAGRPGGTIVPNDQVVPDDIIVTGSACIGLDCVNNEAFGFDTIRLKQGDERIHFEDTSAGLFPSNDWRLTANDSGSGGADRFSIDDSDAVTEPFAIAAGAETNSFFVDSTGRLGLGTSTVVLDLHLFSGNTPASRFEQNAGGGFTAQTWDVAANEANFFVRDVTGGSKLSFRIRPGAPSSSIDIRSNGFVGINDSFPDYTLDVFGDLRVTGGIYLTGPFQAGIVPAASFVGVPPRATVTLPAPFTSADYTVTLTVVGSPGARQCNLISKTSTGFIIGTDGSIPGLVEIDWLAAPLIP